MKGYYQPAGLIGWVNWLWILMIALFGLIMQLEVTHLNVWTYGAVAAFIVIALLTYFRRRVALTKEALWILPMFGVHTDKFRFSEMAYVQFTKRTILFSYDGEHYSFWMNQRFLNNLKKEIEGQTND
ncbi:EbsA family protein [Weissella paramesenteroides]